MTLVPYERMRTLRREAEGDFETLQDRIELFADQLVDQSHLGGRLVEDVSVSVGQNTINHKLGRELRGYWMVSDTAIPAAFKVYLASADTGAAVNATPSKVEFDTESFDYGGGYDLATNNRFDAPQDGIYSFSSVVYISSITDGSRADARLYVNGSLHAIGALHRTGAAGDQTIAVNDSTVALSEDDYVEVFVNQDGGVNEDVNAGETLTWFTGHALIGHSSAQSELSATDQTKFLRLYSQCARTASLVVF